MKSLRWERNQAVLLAPPARSLIMFLRVRKGKDGRTAVDSARRAEEPARNAAQLSRSYSKLAYRLTSFRPGCVVDDVLRFCDRAGSFRYAGLFQCGHTYVTTVYVRECEHEIWVSFEFRSIDDELIAAINKLTDISVGRFLLYDKRYEQRCQFPWLTSAN